ncbi:MAG: type II secretion system major pseudopilin GspG [Pirellulales bacterium]|nr:type II secretion system major pseudopilin GspG [Pirellulales bacterium]
MTTRPHNPPRRRRGFTLIEVLLVLAILVIIASFAVIALGPMQRSAYTRAALAQVKAFKSPLQAYRLDMKDFPSTAQGLEALRNVPNDAPNPDKWAGPYLDSPVPLDPWDQPYQYEYPGKHGQDLPDIWSFGADGIDGTADDVGNWAEG